MLTCSLGIGGGGASENNHTRDYFFPTMTFAINPRRPGGGSAFGIRWVGSARPGLAGGRCSATARPDGQTWGAKSAAAPLRQNAVPSRRFRAAAGDRRRGAVSSRAKPLRAGRRFLADLVLYNAAEVQTHRLSRRVIIRGSAERHERSFAPSLPPQRLGHVSTATGSTLLSALPVRLFATGAPAAARRRSTRGRRAAKCRRACFGSIQSPLPPLNRACPCDRSPIPRFFLSQELTFDF